MILSIHIVRALYFTLTVTTFNLVLHLHLATYVSIGLAGLPLYYIVEHSLSLLLAPHIRILVILPQSGAH